MFRLGWHAGRLSETDLGSPRPPPLFLVYPTDDRGQDGPDGSDARKDVGPATPPGPEVRWKGLSFSGPESSSSF